MIIAAPRLFNGTSLTGSGAVVIENGLITAVLDDVPERVDIRLRAGILAPGLIDLHNNGAFGVDCSTATVEQFRMLAARLATCGVTSFAPTVITAPLDDIRRSAACIAAATAALAGEPVARMVGMHLEGPFLSPLRRGAHRADWLVPPDAARLDALLGDPNVAMVLRLVTLAPELPGALAAIARLKAVGVKVALGHSDANAEVVNAARAAGASLVTHVFTAMRPFHHRDPGLIGCALSDPDLFACFIADAVHADPLALRMGFAAAGDRAVAVTDSVSLAGLAEGAEARFGGATTIIAAGAARRLDGTLSGAIITLDEGLRRLIAAGIPPEAALRATTTAPAHALGLTDRGALRVGARADLVWFDDRFGVNNSWVGGVALQPVAVAEPPTRHVVATEAIPAGLDDLDLRPSEAVIRLLFAQEARAHRALEAQAARLGALVDAVAPRLEAGGRLFYVGAGTSGRLAVLDAVECGPTFSLPPGVIIPIIAGGERAVTAAVEGAEDDTDTGEAAIRRYEVGPADAVVGIAASGATAFTVAAVQAARRAGALTAALCNSAGLLAEAAEYSIVIKSGAEILAGSTRLSAGTTQKAALNALSTTLMIRLGKVHGPHMVDVRATNRKLRLRAERIVAAIGGCDDGAARQALFATDYAVKPAILMVRFGIPAEAATARLAAGDGSLRQALDAP